MLLVAIVLCAAAGAGLVIQPARGRPRVSAETLASLRSVAEAGISDKLSQMMAGNFHALGSSAHPVAFMGGSYWVSVENVDSAERLYRLRSSARYDERGRTIETVVRPIVENGYRAAVFAGNASNDPGYVLALGGSGNDADVIDGDVYCGSDVAIADEARVHGDIRARGSIVGAEGESAGAQGVPRFARLRQGSDADLDVEHLFGEAVFARSPLGGWAWQVPRRSPAHILRKNPSDRALCTIATASDDYFLEDPYEALREDARSAGSDPSRLSLSDAPGEPGTGGNGQVFFIRGNLWLLNRNTDSFAFATPEGESAAVTFVVLGDIFIADDLHLANPPKDGVAFIALEDPARKTGGNIVLGDPADGSLREVHAFLFAENDIMGASLDPRSTRRLAIQGTLSAGNRIDLPRGEGDLRWGLTVRYDPRLLTGELELPALSAQVERATAFSVLSWAEVGP